MTRPATYRHNFRNGPGGWLGWKSNAEGALPLAIENGAAVSKSPWWIDYNHAPPGGGYLHLLYCLHTRHAPDFPRQYLQAGGGNGFVAGGFPLDFRDARMTVELRGELDLRGAQLLLLAQAKTEGKYVNHVLTAQPVEVRPEWSRQTLVLAADDRQWKCLGSRHDRTATYGYGSVADVLRNLNGDIILVLHPLDVRPAGPLNGDPHRLRAGEDYAADPARLPRGCVMLREVEIAFPAMSRP